jgi:hypothetical protein
MAALAATPAMHMHTTAAFTTAEKNLIIAAAVIILLSFAAVLFACGVCV